MKIRFLPFNSVRALSDLETSEIFINQNLLLEDQIESDILHEVTHIISGEQDHTPAWKEIGAKFALDLELPKVDLLKTYRKRLGIPNSIVGNIGNISGVQNILTDFHLLQHYRKFSQRILGNEGHWEFKVERGVAESDNGIGNNYGGTIKLFPVPKGSFPVVVEYIPSVNTFRSPQAQEAVYRAFLAQMKIALGHARRKLQGIPGPDGGQITLDGGDLVTEGREEYEKAVEFAISVGEPLGFYVY